MLNIIRNIKAAVATANSREEAQGSFEWLLLIGVVVVALITAVNLGFPGTLVSDTITSMDTAISGLFA